MATEKVTVTIPREVTDGVRALVQAGRATSVSAFVAEATAAQLAAQVSLAALEEHLGGPPAPELVAAAQEALGITTAPVSTRKAS